MWCAFGLRRKLHAAQKGLEARVAPKPHCAGSTVKWSRQQTKISPRAPVRIMGAGRTQDGLGMKSRLPVRNRLTCPTWREAGFTGPIRLGRSEGLFSLGSRNQSVPRLCSCARKPHYGSMQETGAGNTPRATLRREILAAQGVLEARSGKVSQGKNCSSKGLTEESYFR